VNPTVASNAPLVSIGFPLYRSKRFLETIIRNIDAIDYPHVEILVSDRHLEDDALSELETRYQGDPRFRFLSGTDRAGWVQNFNLLLHAARGKYVVLMGHDDSYPSNYVRELASALEGDDEAVLAFGQVEQLSLDGFLPTLPFTPPPVTANGAWTIRSSLKMLTLWQLWFAFRGMVRRSVVEESNLFIRQTYRNIRADIYWVFGLSLCGRLLYVPSCSCVKRFYRGSTAAGWRFDVPQSLDACRVLGSYLDDHAASGRDALLARAVLYPWCLLQACLPAGAAKRLLASYQRINVRP
jgi:glycosyltransferase involved in cell wall biosynthesis